MYEQFGWKDEKNKFEDWSDMIHFDFILNTFWFIISHVYSMKNNIDTSIHPWDSAGCM